jgi:hypothetical protein
MNNEQKIVQLWQGQPLAEGEFNMTLVMERVEKFQRKIRFRNLTEYAATAVVVSWAAAFAVRSEAPLLVKTGVVLIGLAGLAVATILRLRGHAAAATVPFTRPTRELMSWHRSELVRQRDLLRRVPVWYLGPFTPGLVLLLVGAWLASPGQELRVALTAAFIALVFAGVALLNFRAARRLGEQIDTLGRELEG